MPRAGGVGGPHARSTGHRVQQRRNRATGHPFRHVPDDLWRRIMTVDLDGVFFCAREEIRVMVESGGGTIVNMASILDRKSTRLNSSHHSISYAVFCLK